MKAEGTENGREKGQRNKKRTHGNGPMNRKTSDIMDGEQEEGQKNRGTDEIGSKGAEDGKEEKLALAKNGMPKG